jgi:hypothetical protein
MLEHQRAWLYSDAGTSELLKVIQRAYVKKHGMAPADAQTKTWLTKGAAGKLLFIELVREM